MRAFRSFQIHQFAIKKNLHKERRGPRSSSNDQFLKTVWHPWPSDSKHFPSSPCCGFNCLRRSIDNEMAFWVLFGIAWHSCLLLDLSVVFNICLYWGPRPFYLDLSWSFLIWSALVFAFTWLLDTWIRVLCFAFKTSLMCLSVVHCIHQGRVFDRPSWEVPWSHPCVIWMIEIGVERFKAFPVEFIYMSYVLDYANGYPKVSCYVLLFWICFVACHLACECVGVRYAEVVDRRWRRSSEKPTHNGPEVVKG
jgi:hypothetical protein